MKFLYTTDLHGNIDKYNKVLDYAISNEYKLIHLGADLLPKGSNILNSQKQFIKTFFKKWSAKAIENKIKVLSFFGNDDLYSRKKYFQKLNIPLLDECQCKIDNWIFRAYPWVPVHPFGLLNGCKLDSDNFQLEPFYNSPCDLNDIGEIVQIVNYQKYLKDRGTIENDLKFKIGEENHIIAFHSPPAGLNLDVCQDGRKVGSIAIRNWLENNKAALVLCGHIHENYHVTGNWKSYTNNGILVIQPGQLSYVTSLVEIDMDNLNNVKLIQL
jgi:Icc-related predicted phosphoesterase